MFPVVAGIRKRVVVSRPTWDEYFISLVDAAAMRASCDRGRSGAVFVRDNDVLATGYVGARPGLPDCYEAGHDLKALVDNISFDGTVSATTHCMRTINAEQNGIIRAARNAVSLRGATIYCTMEPCANCAMSLIGLGVKRVVAKHRYHGAGYSRQLLHKVGIHLEVIWDEELYDPQLTSPHEPTKPLPDVPSPPNPCCSEYARNGRSHTEACCWLEGDG